MKKIVLKMSFVIAFCLTNFSSIGQPISLGNGVADWGYQSSLSFFARFKTAIAVDSSGNKWTGYGSIGVQKFDGNTWTLFNVANGNLPSDSVTSIANNGNVIYVGTKNGIAKYLNGMWSTINSSNSQLVSNSVNTLFYNNNILWVGTNNGVSKYDGSTWTTYNTSNSQLCNNNVKAIEQTTNGDMWFGTSSGLSKLSGLNWTSFTSSNSGLVDNNIASLCSDKINRLFIGTNNKGAYVFNNNNIQSLLSLYPTLFSYLYDLNNMNTLNAKISDIAKDTSGAVLFSAFQLNINSVIIKITPFDCKIYYLPQNAFPIFFEYKKNDTIWYVNSDFGSGITVTKNLYSFKLDDRDLRNDCEVLNANNVNAGVLSSGFLFNDYSLRCFMYHVPKNNAASTIFCGSLWLGAKDNNGSLHIAAERYHSNGVDFQPGPISNDTNLYISEKVKWDHVWKVSQSEIEYHKAHYFNSSYIMPVDIASWPGNGIIANGQSKYLAPYVDANNNGKYDPQNGDFPIIRGDQAIYFIYNDDKIHTESSGIPFKAEIHGLAYAFNMSNDTALNNTIFINYRIYNRSINNYDSLYIGSFTDFDIGYGFDDYIGCDSILSMYYGYNGLNIDGSGQASAYGAYPPAQGVAFLNNNLTSFMYFNNSAGGPQTDPDQPIEYYGFMKSLWKDNTHLKYGGSGYQSSNQNINFAYPGIPGDLNSWNEVSANNAPYDRRGVGASGPYSFPKDSCHCFDVAYTFARNYNDSISISSALLLKQYTQHIRNYYNTNLNHNCSDLFSSVNEIKNVNPEIYIYPNPATIMINVALKGFSYKKTITLSDIQGRCIWVKNYTDDNIHIDIHNLTKGIYILQIHDENKTITKKIVKQ